MAAERQRPAPWRLPVLRDGVGLPAQGGSVTIGLAVTRMKCLNRDCSRQTFSAEAADVAARRARRTLLARDPATGRQISPQTAAILCIKPRKLLTPRQAMAVDALKDSSPEFSAMRHLAMRFRGILRSRNSAKLDGWLDDAYRSGIYAMQRFARTLRRDLDAVRNAVTEPWSNGQAEGQISRLKTLKRTMCGRAGVALLRARMLPLHPAIYHTM